MTTITPTEWPWRTSLYALAVSCYFAFGVLVYRDNPSGNQAAFYALSESGQAGLSIWRRNNCHVCHQLYGFGGYLGPDLTHLAARVDNESFAQILRGGVGPMPHFELPEADVAHLFQFLTEINQSGQGHLAVDGRYPTWSEVFDRLRTAGRTAGQTTGIELFESRQCGQCHQPLRLGKLAAPDLSLTWVRETRLSMQTSLVHGRGNMPFYGFSHAQLDELVEFLKHLHQTRQHFQPVIEQRPPLPWFNYQRQ